MIVIPCEDEGLEHSQIIFCALAHTGVAWNLNLVGKTAKPHNGMLDRHASVRDRRVPFSWGRKRRKLLEAWQDDKAALKVQGLSQSESSETAGSACVSLMIKSEPAADQ
jgi:hypothetical protein